MNFDLPSLIISTVAYFVAAYFIKRYLENLGIEKTMTRGLVVFALALAVSYGVAAGVEWVEGNNNSRVTTPTK